MINVKSYYYYFYSFFNRFLTKRISRKNFLAMGGFEEGLHKINFLSLGQIEISHLCCYFKVLKVDEKCDPKPSSKELELLPCKNKKLMKKKTS